MSKTFAEIKAAYPQLAASIDLVEDGLLVFDESDTADLGEAQNKFLSIPQLALLLPLLIPLGFVLSKPTIVGLTGGGATKLDGLASASYPDNAVVYLYNITGRGGEHWIANTGAHSEDGEERVTFDDASGRYWENLG